MALPITRDQAQQVAFWIKSNYGSVIANSISGMPFNIDLICGIACQETAYFWLNFIHTLSPDQVLARCVLDASGDYPGTRRSAFPMNTEAFVKKYGIDAANFLIAEANLTRSLRGFGPQNWVYKGYGIFQYDLQYIELDPNFFFEKQWYSFESCLNRALKELFEKLIKVAIFGRQ